MQNLIIMLSLPAACVPPHIHQINVPGTRMTIQAMMDASEKVGGWDELALLKGQEDPYIKKIVHSWPTRFDNSQAIILGFHRDESFEQAVRDSRFQREF